MVKDRIRFTRKDACGNVEYLIVTTTEDGKVRVSLTNRTQAPLSLNYVTSDAALLTFALEDTAEAYTSSDQRQAIVEFMSAKLNKFANGGPNATKWVEFKP